MSHDPNDYLDACDVVEIHHPDVRLLSSELARGTKMSTAKRCFEFVRDEIRHSFDHQLNPVTCRASDVLQHRTGYCYTKSHLLCALLRANGIPAGLCYQRLEVDDEGTKHCLHGLNAIFLTDHGWYRVDARANREDVRAEFNPPHEQLAFTTLGPGEYDYTGHLHPLLA
jgi:transglutaminase-like putative cysteine protease